MRHIRIIFAIVLASTLVALTAFGISATSIGVETVVNDSFSGGITTNKHANNKGDGSYPAQSGMTARVGTDGGKYGVFYPTLTGSNPGHAFITSPWSPIYLSAEENTRYLVYEFDLATETQYTADMNVEIISRVVTSSGSTSLNSVTYFRIKEDASGRPMLNAGSKTVALEEERGAWQHITFVVDVTLNNAAGSGSVNSQAYVYLNGEQIASVPAFGTKSATYVEAIRFSVAKGLAVDKTDTTCVDNIRLTRLTTDYSGNLASVLADPTKKISEVNELAYKEGYVFPKARAIASVGSTEFSTVSEIEAALKPGDMLTLLNDVYDTIDIPCPISIYNPNGKLLKYNKGEFEEYKSGSTVTFMEAFKPVDVVFHLGDTTKTVTYTEPTVITPVDHDEIITVDGIERRAIGFAKSPNGKVLSDLGVVSEYNKEFWLVYASPIAFAEHTAGGKAYAYDNSELDTLISGAANGDVIKLLADATIYTRPTSAFTFTAREVTIDLAGCTLSLSDNCPSDVFTVGEYGTLTVKNGSLYMPNNGRTKPNSSDILRKRIFSTASVAEGARIFAENLDITACKMIALIRGGAACTFTDCTIDFTKDYENMVDLYSSNLDTPTTLTFTRCTVNALKTVVNTYRTSNVTKHNTEIHLNECDITTEERLITLESLGAAYISGGKYKAQYLFGKTNANTDATVFITLGTEFNYTAFGEATNTPTPDLNGGAIARKNSEEYPYEVSQNVATVTWSVSPNKKSEVWLKGEVPTCPLEVPKNTSAITYTFGEILPVSEDVAYALSAEPTFDVKIKALLGADLSLNVYVPDVDFSTVRIGLTNYSKAKSETVLIDGVPYYRFNTGRIDPALAANAIKIKVTILAYNGNVSFSSDVSLVAYLEKLLEESTDTKTYMLALSMISYIEESVDDPVPELIECFEKYRPERVKLPAASVDGKNYSSVISSAELSVTRAGTYVRLNFNEAFTGMITLTYSSGGKETEKKVAVVSGKAGKAAYVEISGDAIMFFEGIGLKTDTLDTVIGIDSCITEENERLIDALYTYGKYTHLYISGKGEDK